MSKVAVIQTAFHGDVILCTPMFESLKSAGHEVVAVVRPQAELLIRHNPYIDEIVLYDKHMGVPAFLRAVYELRRTNCDISLSVQRYLKSALLPVYADIPKRIGFASSQVRSLYTDEVKYDRTKHEVERCLALCEGLSPTTGFAPKIEITPEDLSEANSYLNSHHINLKNFVVMAPGSIWATKRWVGYRELAELLTEKYNCDIVLLGSEQDYEVCLEVAKFYKAVSLAGKTNLLQSAGIIRMARLAISNDSAPGHIAAAVGTPVVAIFGPTVPAFGFAPYIDKTEIVENIGLYCRPCSPHGPMKCPEKHFRCMKEITPERVLRACDTFLA